MLIRVRATQIPKVWDVIKFAADRANEIEGEPKTFYNQVLLDLLNDHAQCFVRLSPERHIQMIGVTKILANPLAGTKHLLIQFVYSFGSNPGAWAEDIENVKAFAKQMSCNLITCETKNPQILALIKPLGFTEAFRTMALRLED